MEREGSQYILFIGLIEDRLRSVVVEVWLFTQCQTGEMMLLCIRIFLTLITWL